MEGEAIGLAVLLVPGEAQPLEPFEDGIEGLFGVTAIDTSTAWYGVRKATICMIHAPEGLTGAVAL